MSYILEALRKAERERAGSAVPSTATEHQLPAPPKCEVASQAQLLQLLSLGPRVI